MIAIEMAKILVAQGETISHVIMIDSMNPETFLSFRDEREHRLVAAMTYNAISRRMNGPEEPTALMMLDNDSLSRGSTSNSSSADTSRENSDGEVSSDEDEDSSDDLFYSQLRQHIYNGLRMLSTYRSTVLPGKQHWLPETDVTLVKCKVLGPLSPLLETNRRIFAEKTSKDNKSGWSEERFRHLATVPFRATHNACFDEDHADELTAIMKTILSKLD
jgi:thioesterase domain-containing protein